MNSQHLAQEIAKSGADSTKLGALADALEEDGKATPLVSHALRVAAVARTEGQPSAEALEQLRSIYGQGYDSHPVGEGVTLHVRRPQFKTAHRSNHRPLPVPDTFPALVLEHSIGGKSVQTVVPPSVDISGLYAHLPQDAKNAVALRTKNAIASPEPAYHFSRKESDVTDLPDAPAGSRWHAAETMLSQGRDAKTVASVLHDSLGARPSEAVRTVQRLMRANEAPKRCARKLHPEEAAEHDTMHDGVRATRDVSALGAFADRLTDYDHPNAKLLSAAVVRAPYSALRTSSAATTLAAFEKPDGTVAFERVSPTVDRDHFGNVIRTGVEQDPAMYSSHNYRAAKNPDGTSYIETTHRSEAPFHASVNGAYHDPVFVHTPVHSKADVRELTSDLHPGIQRHLLAQLSHLPETHESGAVHLARTIGTGQVGGKVIGDARRVAMGRDPHPDQIAAGLAAQNDAREAVVRNHTDNPVAALRAKARSANDQRVPLDTAFKDPSAQSTRTMQHEDGGHTTVTRYHSELIPTPVYHVQTTLPGGKTFGSAMSHGEYESWVNSHTPEVFRTPERRHLHPLRFAAKLAPVLRGALRSGKVDPYIRDTSLHYHLKQIEQAYKDEAPGVSALATKALTNDPASFEALGKELAKKKSPLAKQYNWNRISDSLATDKMLESHLNTYVNRKPGESDTAFFDRIHQHMGAAAEGRATGKVADFWKRLQEHTRNHSYLSKHLDTPDRLLDSLHRIADRHSEREHLAAINGGEPTVGRKAQRMDAWLEANHKGSVDLNTKRRQLRHLLSEGNEGMVKTVGDDEKGSKLAALRAKMVEEFGSLADARAALDASIAAAKAGNRGMNPVPAKQVDPFVSGVTASRPEHMKFARPTA